MYAKIVKVFSVLIFFINFFPIYKIVGKILSKKANKERIQSFLKGIKIFLKKKKTKNVNIFMNGTEISLKKREAKGVNMVANDSKIFLKLKS